MNVNDDNNGNISELLIVIVVEAHEDGCDGIDNGEDQGGQWL